MRKSLLIGALIGIGTLSSTYALDCDRLIQRFNDKGITSYSDLLPEGKKRLQSCLEESKEDANTQALKKFYPEAYKDPKLNLGKNSKFYDKEKYEVKSFSQAQIQDRSNYYDVIAVEINFERFEEESEVKGQAGHYIVTRPNALCAHLFKGSTSMESQISSKKVYNSPSKPVGIKVEIEENFFSSDEIKKGKFDQDRNVYVYESITCAKAKDKKDKIGKKDIDSILHFKPQMEGDDEEEDFEDARVNNGNNRNQSKKPAKKPNLWGGSWDEPSNSSQR